MLRNIISSSTIKSLGTYGLNTQQIRNTFLLKRRWPPGLNKQGGSAKKLKAKHFIYDLVEHTSSKKSKNLSIILTDYVAGVGQKGDLVELQPRVAYNEMLLPGLAVYASPENIFKYHSKQEKVKDESNYSSPFAEMTIRSLSRMLLTVSMSKTTPWVLQPWHIRASFRKAAYVVPEYAIEMPPSEIRGPDLDIQNKEFFVTVTINKKEKVNVRCRLHHFEYGSERIPGEINYWEKECEALFPEQEETLKQMRALKITE